METNAVGAFAFDAGRQSNFSISGKEISTIGFLFDTTSQYIVGRRCIVCGPNTISTKGARSRIASPS